MAEEGNNASGFTKVLQYKKNIKCSEIMWGNDCFKRAVISSQQMDDVFSEVSGKSVTNS